MPKQKFKQELSDLLNKNCEENNSNTPDFILAKYLQGCLNAFNDATKTRDIWYYGNVNKPGKTDENAFLSNK
jgi:hypothetical protein